MTSGRPWWYSGDEATEALGDPTPREDVTVPAPSAEAGDPPPAAADGRLDVAALAQGAQRLIEWATERVVAPHAEHGDPAAHPDCLMCRAALLMGPAGQPGPAPAASVGPDPVAPITWLPVIDERPLPASHP